MVLSGTIQQQLMGMPVVSEEEMRRLEEEKRAGEVTAKRLSGELDITITRLKAGEITSIEQIPLEQRKYLDIPQGFFEKVGEYHQQKSAYELAMRENKEWALARKLILTGKGWVAQDVPSLRKKVKALREEGLQSYHTISATRPSLASSEIIAAWSEKHKMSPSLETVKRILAGDVTPYYGASPVYESFKPSWETPSEQFSFGEVYGVSTKAPAPSMISAYEGAVIPYEQTWWGATKQAVGRVPTGIQMTATGLITEFEPAKGLKYIFAPYKYGTRIGEEKISVIEPQFGTIVSKEHLPTEAKPFIGTKFEFAKMKGFEPSPKLYETRMATLAPVVVETGFLIGASFTPAGAGVVSGYITARSFKQTIESPTISGKVLGVAGVGLGLYGMSATMRGLQSSITSAEISEAVAYKPQLKFGTRETLKGGVIKDVYSARYQIGGTKVIKEAEIYSKLISGEKYAVMGRGSVFARTTEYMTGKPITYMAGTELKGLGFGLGVGTKGWQPSISVGRVSKDIEVMVRGGKGRIYVAEKFAPLKGKVKTEWEQTGMFLYKKRTIEPILGKKIKFIKEAPEKFVVGGISKEAREKIITFGGKVKEFKPAWKVSGIEIESPQFKFGVEEISLIKIKQPPKSDIGFITTFGKKSSQEFLKQMYAPPTPMVAEKLIQAPSIKVQPYVPSAPTTGAGAIISQVKLKELIKPISAEKIMLREKAKEKEALIQPSKMRAIVKVREIQKVVQAPKMDTALISKFEQKLALAPALISGQALIPKQKLGLKQALITTPETPPPTTGFPPPTGGFPFLFPPFTLPRRELKPTRKVIKVKRILPREKYRPSFVALGLGIAAPRIPKAYFRGAGGLIIRPIIVTRIKKRRKKK